MPGQPCQRSDREGRYTEAEKIARKAFEANLRNLGPQRALRFCTAATGIALALDGSLCDARKLFRDVDREARQYPGTLDALPVGYYFACVAAASNHPDDALQSSVEAIDNGFKETD